MSEPLELHRQIQEHLDSCPQCNAEMKKQQKKPAGFGQKADFCDIYWLILRHEAKPEERTMHNA